MLDFSYKSQVKFNLKGYPDERSQNFIGTIAQDMAKRFPIVPSPANSLHVTFGQSSYFNSNINPKSAIKLPVEAPSIGADFNNILKSLTSGLTVEEITRVSDATVTSVKISDHGFVLYTLDSPFFAARIAELFQNASLDAARRSNTAGFLGLTTFYEKGAVFQMHITVGQLANINDKDHYNQILTSHFNQGWDPMCKHMIRFSSTLTLDATYKPNDKHIDIYKHKVCLEDIPSTRRMVLFSQPRPLETFANDLLASLPVPATRAEIAEGIKRFYPERDFTSLHMPNETTHGKYEIVFSTAKHKMTFATRFSHRFSGISKRGLCKYLNGSDADFNPYVHSILMDELGIETLLGRNAQANDNRTSSCRV